MKLPLIINRRCVSCNKHQPLTVTKVSKGKASTNKWINRQKARRGTIGNLGKFSKVPAKRDKQSKKPHLFLKCSICSFKNIFRGRRTKKFQILNK